MLGCFCASPKNFAQAISKMQIPSKDKARADEKAQHTWECEHFEEARNTVIER